MVSPVSIFSHICRTLAASRSNETGAFGVRRLLTRLNLRANKANRRKDCQNNKVKMTKEKTLQTI